MSEDDDQLNVTISEAIEALDHSDSFETLARLTSAGEPGRVMKGFQHAVRELFSQRKLPQMVWIGRGGIEYALREAHTTRDPDLRSELLAGARKLSYNVSANLWPGWADAAVQPNSSDLQAALDLARLHQRLVQDEQLDLETRGNARWLIGAQRLALGQEQSAHHSFETAKADYQAAGNRTSEWMAEGFQALSLQLMGTMGAEGLRRFEAAIQELKQLGDDGEFFVDQLQTAKRVFLGK